MKAKFPTMVQYFLEDAETYISTIREGVMAANVEKIVSPAHTAEILQQTDGCDASFQNRQRDGTCSTGTGQCRR